MKIEERRDLAKVINQLADANDQSELINDAKRDLIDILERESNKTIEVNELGAHARVKFTRGSDVRHQDEWTFEVHSESTLDAKRQMDELIEQYETHWGQRVADLNPDR